MTLRRALLLASITLVGCPETPPDEDAGTDGGRPDVPLVCEVDVEPEADLPEPSAHTPRWAFEPWISKDISDRADTFEFVAGFLERDIPVGAVVLDSPWDSNYTTFTPNPTRYADFGEMVEELHGMDIRVVLWTTQMVNQRSFDLEMGGDRYPRRAITFDEGQACGFLAEEGAVFSWWKGDGSGVDFFDARARAWWHSYQDRVLDLGIDGWKLDFGESYMETLDPVTGEPEPITTDAGEVTFQAYSEAYYRDFLAYGVTRRGRDFTTMVRGWDRSYDRVTRFFARPEHAPVVWAGDNRRDWLGLEDALETMLRSAEAGYVVVGSDIGGYLDRDDLSLSTRVPFDGEVFDRWVAVGAMNPFMQLHGRANLAPWTVPERVEETVANYRYWAHLHHAMVPYWYSLATAMYATPALDSCMTPIGADTEWAGDYRYTIGDAFLVAPIVAAGGTRDVPLPAGADWYDWWNPSGAAIAGGFTVEDYDASDWMHLPMFVRAGAIVPVEVATDANGLGSAASEGFLTVLGWPAPATSTFNLIEEATDVSDSLTQITMTGGASVSLGFVPMRGNVIARLRAESAPTSVMAGTTALVAAADTAAFESASSGYLYDAANHWLWIKVTSAVSSITVE